MQTLGAETLELKPVSEPTYRVSGQATSRPWLPADGAVLPCRSPSVSAFGDCPRGRGHWASRFPPALHSPGLI